MTKTNYETQDKYHLIEYDGYSMWEKITRVQEYNGHTILTISSYQDCLLYSQIRKHREYRIIFPDGHSTDFSINKRGGNIKELKYWIDNKKILAK